MDGHNDNDICVCRMCILSMKIADVRSNLGGGETARPHVIPLTCHGVLTDYNTPPSEAAPWRSMPQWAGQRACQRECRKSLPISVCAWQETHEKKSGEERANARLNVERELRDGANLGHWSVCQQNIGRSCFCEGICHLLGGADAFHLDHAAFRGSPDCGL